MDFELTGWETTRLSDHFILLDFLADHAIYRSGIPLSFNETWNDEHDSLARGLCNKLLEPLMATFGPVSVSDAFWPPALSSCHHKAGGPKHRWTGGEATIDIAPYRLVDKGKTGSALKREVDHLSLIDDCRDRVLSYPNTEFLCVTYKASNARSCGQHDPKKKQSLRAHHVRVGRHFNLLDFCRNGRAVEEGVNLVPELATRDTPDYRPIAEEAAARSFAAALDLLVDQIGRISVVRGIETEQFASDEHAELHRWDLNGPQRLVFVLPQHADPDSACQILKDCQHVREVKASPHPSSSHSITLVVDHTEYQAYRGLRPAYSS